MILRAVEAGEGEPLVLLHGLFGAARNFGAVQRALAGRFRVIALDLRNHGASPHAPDMSYAAMAADVLETLDQRAALPSVLLGHSMGGKVAMQAALTHGDAVAKLIVADIAPVPYPAHFAEIASAMHAIPLDKPVSRGEADTLLERTVPDAVLRAFLLQNFAPGSRPHWQIGLQQIAAALPVIGGWDPPAGASYRGRTLFMAGERSDYIRPEHRAAIRALFPSVRFVTLKGAGHWLHAENPEGFVSILESFA